MYDKKILRGLEYLPKEEKQYLNNLFNGTTLYYGSSVAPNTATIKFSLQNDYTFCRIMTSIVRYNYKIHHFEFNNDEIRRFLGYV